MALIYFYDSTELDKKQITESLRHSDHHWEYVSESISPDNINPEVEVISVFVTSKVDRELMQSLPKLKLIACRSTGFNNVDLRSAEEFGITVVNVPSYGERTVAEYAFALILTLTRKLKDIANDPNTDDQIKFMGMDVFEKAIGVIGTGKIGSNVIRIAKGFGMRVLAYDPFPKPELAKELQFEYVDLDDLLSNSDIVTLHVPFMGNNRHFIDEVAFNKMKNGVIFINTARGELVDTSALIQALGSEKVSAAGLDVLEEEKLMSLHGEIELLQASNNRHSLMHSVELLALQKMPNVVLTPHNAFNTLEAIGRINSTTTDNILKFWYGDVPNKVVFKKTTGKLIIVRHAESEWNALGKWTGTRDVHLSELGFKQAGEIGRIMPDIKIDLAITSEQIRTRETLQGILEASGQYDVEVIRNSSVNERDYGDETGKVKWDVKSEIGEEAFNKMRRDWDYPVPNGETLKDVYQRALPYYKDFIVPKILDGKNILLVAHGNSIRALMKYIENIPEEKMGDVEMIFGAIVVYDIDQDGHMTSKKVSQIETTKAN